MTNECVAVFTARSPKRILREGGSQAWALDPVRARKCRFLICVQNQNNPDRDFSDASEQHGAVFMIGKISDVIPAPENPTGGRWQIRIDEYSIHHVPNSWKGWRNPVRYTTLEEMGIDIAQLEFHAVAQVQEELKSYDIKSSVEPAQQQTAGQVMRLSIATAKVGLAAYYNVDPNAIEIIIRG